ncbi:MAG: RimK family alpha-L-glutamate ligase [Thermofilum sp. ex4484_15]|nr:MAG: RimK family alpha-L-glutamate ligase [Thermofilum sp. ex4484_15]
MQVGGLAIIHASPIPPKPTRIILAEFKKMGVKVRYLPIQAISLYLSPYGSYVSVGGKKLELRGALLRGIGFSLTLEQFFIRIGILKYLESEGVRFVNKVSSLLRTRNKLETLIALYRAGLRVPTTLATESLKRMYLGAKALGDVVLKPVMGSRGLGSVRTNDADVAFQIVKTLSSFNQPPLLQEYVEKPKRDIRAFVIGGEVVACMYRYSRGSWKTNVAQGGIGAPLNPPEEVKEMALKCLEVLELDYAGVDIAEGKEGFYVLEVNGSPDFEELSRVSGLNIAKLLAEYFLSVLKR